MNEKLCVLLFPSGIRLSCKLCILQHNNAKWNEGEKL